jgi:DNA-binding NarL/FixJ family response regulator
LERTRVILVDMPRVLREIVRKVLSHEPDVEMVEEDTLDAALAAIRASDDCVVVTQLERGERIAIDRLLDTHRKVRVLALSADGRDGAVYELHPKEHLLGEMSPPVLLAAIRAPRA